MLCEVCNRCGCEGGCCGITVEDGDDCGWWCVLKGVVYGNEWYGLQWVWLERCRDSRYAVNASRCDVWVVCACLPVCIVACFVGFWGSFFAESASLHDWLLWYFLESAFSVTFLGCFFW